MGANWVTKDANDLSATLSPSSDAELENRRLEKEVQERLAKNTNPDIRDVRCEVFDGTATLSGWVVDERRKDLAGKIAGLVEGVREVDNRLAVGREGLGVRPKYA